MVNHDQHTSEKYSSLKFGLYTQSIFPIEGAMVAFQELHLELDPEHPIQQLADTKHSAAPGALSINAIAVVALVIHAIAVEALAINAMGFAAEAINTIAVVAIASHTTIHAITVVSSAALHAITYGIVNSVYVWHIDTSTANVQVFMSCTFD